MPGSALVRALALLLVLGGLGWGGPAATPAAAQGQDRYLFRGSSVLSVELTDAYGRSLGVSEFATDVGVTLRAPYPGDPNPFMLVVQSEPLIGDAGETSLWTALPAEGTVFRYWTLDVDATGDGFTGELTDAHTSEAVALNLVTIPYDVAPNLNMPYILAMAEGAHMTGSWRYGILRVEVEGNTTDGRHPFRWEIVARLR